MVLIIGGAYQGKRQYALQHYAGQELIDGFHLLVLEQIRQNIDPVEHAKQHITDYANKVILCDDISCGVVPTDPLLRQWRESLGHTLAVLVQNSSEVVRVFCTLGTRLK